MASTFFASPWCDTEVRCGWMVECEFDGIFLENLLCLMDRHVVSWIVDGERERSFWQ